MKYDTIADTLTLTRSEVDGLNGFGAVVDVPETASNDPVTLPYPQARRILACVDAMGVPRDPGVRGLVDTIGAVLIRGHHNRPMAPSVIFGPADLVPLEGAEQHFPYTD